MEMVALSATIKMLRQPESAEHAAKEIALLCQVDSPASWRPANAFLRNAPTTMPVHEAIRIAVVRRGGVKPLLQLINDAAAERRSHLQHTSPMPSCFEDTTVAIAHAMLAICLVSIDRQLRAEIIEAGAIRTLATIGGHVEDGGLAPTSSAAMLAGVAHFH